MASCSAFSSSTTSSNCGDEPHHVAAAQDPAGHAVGPELLQPVERLAHADVLDRLAGDRLDRQGGAAARVAVQLGQDDAVVGQPVVEGLGGGHRVLADHGVDHEEDVGRVAATLDLLQLVHQRLVDGEPAGGVEDDRVAARFGGDPLGLLADERRAASRLGEDRHVQLLAQDAELVDGSGAVHVRGNQQGPAAALFQQARQLADGGGLAAPLQAHHHDAGGTLLGEADARVDRPHQLDQLVVAELDEVVLRGHATDFLLAARPAP